MHGAAYTSGNATSIGGLIGSNDHGDISDSYATGTVTGAGFSGNASDVGGLIGTNSHGNVSNSYATGSSVTGVGKYGHASNVGGLIGNNSYGTVSDSHATGNVTGKTASNYGSAGNIGGLVGNNFGAGVSNSHASGNVDGLNNVGGLIGHSNNYYGGTISGSYATGNVSASSSKFSDQALVDSVGGLVGSLDSGSISNSYASGSVTASTLSQYGSAGTSNVGGLVGSINNGSISDSHASGIVSASTTKLGTFSYGSSFVATTNVGGLVGSAGSSSISNSYADGGVTATTTNGALNGSAASNSVGGLVGYGNGNSVSNSHATGAVGASATGSYGSGSGNNIGGLAGYNVDGSIDGSYATGSVNGGNNVGGLLGRNSGTISTSYASGNVNADHQAGGLVGNNYGTISNSYATGSSSTTNGQSGGLVGINYGSVGTSYATGSVSGGAEIGGLIGRNYGTVTDTYAKGSVNGVLYVGGLVGLNYLNGINVGTISTSYATGSVSGGAAGGLVGWNAGVVSSSYWNKFTSGTTIGIGVGSLSGAVGLTNSQMKQHANFVGFDFTNIWRQYDGHSNPLLKTFLTPLTVTANDKTKTYNGLTFSGGAGYTKSVVTSGDIHGVVTYTGNSQGAKDAGSYTITPGGLFSNTQQGYDITFVDGSLTVNQKALTASISGTTSKVYDGTTSATINTANYVLNGFVSGESATVTETAGTYNSKNVLQANKVTATLDSGDFSADLGTNLSNYILPTTAKGTGQITPAALTITSNVTKTYNGQAFSSSAGQVSYIGLVNGETSAVLSGTLAFGGDAQTAVNAGSYTITVSGKTSSNYDITNGIGALTVNKKALTASISGTTSKVYDGNTSATIDTSHYVLNGFVSGESATVTETSGTYNSKNVLQANKVTATLDSGDFSVGSGTLLSNYILPTTAKGTGQITAAPLTVTAKDKTKNVNGVPFSGGNGVIYAGFVNSETSGVLGGLLTYGGTSQGKTAIGTYTITPSGYTSSNYTISYFDGTLTIH